MSFYNFQRLIRKYSREFTVITKGKSTVNEYGDRVSGEETKTTLYGAIIGYAERKVYQSAGNITEQDKALHMLEPIDNALMGGTVIFKGNEYKIETQKGKDNAEFTGVYSYTLKWVSAFKGGGDNV